MTLKMLPEPVVLEPVMLTRLPVKPVVVPVWVTANALWVVCDAFDTLMFKPFAAPDWLITAATAAVPVVPFTVSGVALLAVGLKIPTPFMRKPAV